MYEVGHEPRSAATASWGTTVSSGMYSLMHCLLWSEQMCELLACWTQSLQETLNVSSKQSIASLARMVARLSRPKRCLQDLHSMSKPQYSIKDRFFELYKSKGSHMAMERYPSILLADNIGRSRPGRTGWPTWERLQQTYQGNTHGNVEESWAW